MATNYDELPAYGYRSDARIAASAPYGTYPSKRVHSTRFLGGASNVTEDALSEERPLIRSTANAYETHWQPPANPNCLPLLELPRETADAATPQSQRRASRADSPQRGILRRRANDSPAPRPNLFDCPSASTLALSGPYANVNGSASPARGRSSYASRNGGGGGGVGGVSPAVGLAEELRKLSATESRTYPNKSATIASDRSATADDEASNWRRRCRFCVELGRAAAVECAAMTLLVLVHVQSRAVLGDALRTRHWEASAVVALADAAAATALYAALPTTQLNPLVTVGHMLSSVAPLSVCLAALLSQLLAVFLSAAFLFLYLRHDSRHALKAPAGEFGSALDGASSGDAFARQMIISGALGTSLLVLAHLRASRDVWRSGDDRRRPLAGLFAAVWLAAFLGLAHSHVSWNVAFADVSAAVQSAEGAARALRVGDAAWTHAAAAAWRNHHVFWLGPTIGALLAGCLYRLAHSPESSSRVHELVAAQS